MDLENPNAATESQVTTTKDGLVALAIGIQQVYSVNALGPMVLTPSVSTRETAIMTTFANLEELEFGGTNLSGENGYTNRLFSNLTRVKGMSEELINSVDNIDVSPQYRANLKSWGQFFRALCLGALANNYEQVPLVNKEQAQYVSRQEAYNEAIRLLQNTIDELTAQGISIEFNNQINNTIDLLNASRLYLARFHLYAGNYNAAISMANTVDKSSSSFFNYDNQNPNPINEGLFVGTISYAPRQNFGLPIDQFTIDAGDQRLPFFLSGAEELSLNNLPVRTLNCPFYQTNTSAIPVYVPGESLLIIAEANARLEQFVAAEQALNTLRQKQPTEDVLGIGAGLTDTYTANGNVANLLKEIYKNRRIELFLTGNSLADSRRFNRPEPTEGYTSERNRNFYPYASDERLNNDNTPPNPAI